jgi:hypothetical protein
MLQASAFCWAWPRRVCSQELYSIYRGEFVAQQPRTACIKQLPSDVFTLISWYKRSELGSRVAVIYSAATIAGAFSVYIQVTLGYGKLLTIPNNVNQVVSSLWLSITWTASAGSPGGHGFSF